MHISPIPRQMAIDEWPVLEYWLRPAIRHASGRYDLDDLFSMIQDDEAQVWVAVDGAKINGVLVTQIIDYPKKSTLFIVCMAGKNFHLWDNVVHDYLIPFAIQNECQAIEFFGRKGWERRAKRLGFETVYRTYELAIKDDCDARVDGTIQQRVESVSKLH